LTAVPGSAALTTVSPPAKPPHASGLTDTSVMVADSKTPLSETSILNGAASTLTVGGLAPLSPPFFSGIWAASEATANPATAAASTARGVSRRVQRDIGAVLGNGRKRVG